MNNPLDISKMYGLENKNNPYNNTKAMISSQINNQYTMPPENTNTLPAIEAVYNSKKINSKTASMLSANETMSNSKNANTVNKISVAHKNYNTATGNHNSDYNNSATQCPLIKNKDKNKTENSSTPYPAKNIPYANPYITSNNTNIIQKQISHSQPQNAVNNSGLVPYIATDNFSVSHSVDTTTVPTNNLNTNKIADNIATQDLQCMNSFLRTQTGKKAQVEFRDNYSVTFKYGYLVAVGENYIVLQEFNSDNLLVCDNNDIKFITLCN